MTEFSDLQVTQIILAILVSAAAVGAAIYGVFRKTYCRGKDKGTEDSNHANEITELNNKYNALSDRLDSLETNIQVYRSKTEQKLEEITKNQTELKSDLADIKGYLEGKFGKANGT